MERTFRILFTCIGRRVELVQAFQSAARRLGLRLLIYGTDITHSAPALKFCDRTIIVPKIRENSYTPNLLKICSEEQIDALIPTIDTDLLLLAKNKKQFEQLGTKVLISSEEKVMLCRDKRLTAEYFHSAGLRSPSPVDDIACYCGTFPAFIKPKDGSSSVDAYKADSWEELQAYTKRVRDYIIQPFVSGTEYTIDVFCDFEGNPIYITPRIRLAVRAGEVLRNL